MSSPRRPQWLSEECPAWCVAEHADEDHPHDRKHVSVARVVPVNELAGGGGPRAPDRSLPGRGRVEAAELVVCLHRRVGAADTWVYIGDGLDQRLEISADSCARLLPVVGSVMAEWRRPPSDAS